MIADFSISIDKLEFDSFTSMCDGTAHKLESRYILQKQMIENVTPIYLYKEGRLYIMYEETLGCQQFSSAVLQMTPNYAK